MKKRPRLFAVLLLFASIVFSGSASPGNVRVVRVANADYISLDDLIGLFGFDHSFDMVTQKGRLYRKNHNAVYSVGLSALLIDGRLYKSPAAVRRSMGKILIPYDACQSIIGSLDPGTEIRRSGDALFVDRRQDNGQAVPPEKQTYRKPVKDRICFIVIDPGHGGKDPGALGKGGLREKEITLKVARLLEKKLNSRLKGVRLRLTRKNDSFIELSQRTQIANRLLRKNENGVFVSIHVNSSLSKKISGSETYFLSQNPTNEEARNTAALENNVVILEEKSKSRKKSYDDVDFIEATMITTQIQKESSEFAGSIQKGLAKNNKAFSSRGVKKADFFVLRGVLMPAVLVEIGFITNAKEAGYLKKAGHQEIIAEGIADGIELFIKRYNRLLGIH